MIKFIEGYDYINIALELLDRGTIAAEEVLENLNAEVPQLPDHIIEKMARESVRYLEQKEAFDLLFDFDIDADEHFPE